MKLTFSFYLKDREDAVEVDGANLVDDGVKLTVVDPKNVSLGVFLWSELQGYTVED